MGWSESYYDDMKREAQAEIRDRITLLLSALEDLRDVMSAYREFTPDAKRLRDIAEELERQLKQLQSE